MNERSNGIVLLGLGPGDPQQLTREAWEHLLSISTVYLRTSQHPAVEGFPSGLKVVSFDELYATGETFEQVYAQIIDRVLELGRGEGGVTYAVPGHPYVAETTGPAIARRAKEEGIPLRVIEGISFLDPTCTALGIDPFPALALVDALDLAALHIPAYPLDTPALISQVYSRQVASEVKLTLNAVYPDEHRVRLVHAAGTQAQLVEDLALYEIDRSPHIGLLTALYVPPLGVNNTLEGFQEIVAHLRAPDGCPWDKEQTLQSLGPDLLEETYEALAALDQEDFAGLCEELGDIVLMVTMLAQIASEEGYFQLSDVIQGIQAKIIRRHPHVFGDARVSGTAGVLLNWERLKEDERKEKNGGGQQEEIKGLLDGVAPTLPALSRAQEFQSRAAHVGFDWPDIEGVKEKLLEEWGEVARARGADQLEHELGDLLFSAVNLSRWYKTDAETALRKANQRFQKRFKYIEAQARQKNLNLTDLNIGALETLWQEAKRLEEE